MPVSTGNIKVGAVPNVSLMPCSTCRQDVPCAKRGNCYALKSLMYPNVRRAWGDNTAMAQNDRDGYFTMVTDYLKRKSPRLFRWHVSGDIPPENSQDYLERMKTVAREFPDTRFLVFTKRFGLDFRNRPANLSVVFSMWPGMPVPRRKAGIRRAWVQDGTETRVPADSIECSGNCESCGMCWQLDSIGRDVWFAKH